MNILIVSSFLPHPLFSGGHIRLYHIIKELSKKHKISLVCEKRAYQAQKDIDEVKKFCDDVITVERGKQWTIGNIIKTGFSSYPFLITGHTNAQMKQKIQDILKQKSFDVIHVETFYVMQNLPLVTIPIVLVEHNIEYLVYKRFANHAPLFAKPLLYIDVLKIKHWENVFWKKATKLVVVSEVEKKLTNKKDAAIVPNGVDVQKYTVKNIQAKIDRKEKRVLFIGDFKWVQNTDSASWILKEIWPLIKLKVDLKLWIVGKNIPQAFKKAHKDLSIIFDEEAESTSDIFSKADVLLAPKRVGGGTSFKILEALSSGVPVVTTPLGAEGISAEHNKEIMVAKTSKELADAVCNVLTDKKLYERLAHNGRLLIETKYDWKIIVRTLEQVYASVI